MALNTQGKVSTTGIRNQTGTNYQVPNMSKLKVEQPKAPTNINRPVNTQSIEDTNKINVIESIKQNVTAEDINVIAPFLSPSVKSVLTKIEPRLTSVLEGIGPIEEMVPVKVSTLTLLPDDIQKFIIESSTNQMDTNNVPLDTTTGTTGMMAKQESALPETPDEGMNYDQIDQDLIT